MATVINNPDSGTPRESGSGMGTLIGAIVLVLILILFFVYGLPAIRGSRSNSGTSGKLDVNVTTPSSGTSGGSSSGTAQ